MTELAVSYRLNLNASQFTASTQAAGGLYQSFGTQVRASSGAADKGVQGLSSRLSGLAASLSESEKKAQQLAAAEGTLNRALAAGQINQARHAELLALATTRYGAHTSAVDKHAMSEKAMSAALRGVPAQFTDIFTSIASGQSPMTVMIQQGGQLKDMFGGAGPAAKALGGYVIGLVNPFTVVAAVIGGVGLAYYQGSKEADAYTRSIVLSGNAAGVTVGELQDMARETSQVVGTQGAAAEALAAMAGSGKVAGDSLQRYTQLAIEMQRTTGQSVGETVKIFTELGQDPVKASAKLNETLGYLTAATYAQVRAAKALGDEERATSIAQDAYASAMQARTVQIEANLGSIEKGWRAIKSAILAAGDAMLGIGRTSSLSERLAEVNAQIEKARKPFDASSFGGNAEARAKLPANLQLQASLQEMIRLEKRGAEAAGERAAANRAGVEAVDKVTAANDRYASKQVQLDKALKDYRKSLDDIRAADPNSALLDPKKIAAAEAGIRKQYTETAKLGDAYADSRTAAKTWEKAMEDAQEALSRATGKTEHLSESERKLRDYMASSAAVIMGQKVPAANAQFEATMRAAIAQEKLNEAERGATKAAEDATRYAAGLNAEEGRRITGLREAQKAVQDYIDSVDASAAALQFETSLMGLDTQARANAIAQYRIQIDLKKRLKEIDEDPRYTGDAEAVAAARETARQKARDAAVREGATASAQAALDKWQSTADRINDDLTEGILNAGKDGGRGLREALQNELLKKPFRMAVQALITPVGNALASAVTGGSGAASGFSGASGALSTIGMMTGNFGAGLGAGFSAGLGSLGGGWSLGTGMMGAGSTAGGLGAMLGDPLTMGIAALFSIISSLDDSGTYHTGGAARYSAAGGSSVVDATTLGTADVVAAAATEQAVAAAAKSIASVLDATALAFGKTAGYEAATAFADDTSDDGAWGALVITKLGEKIIDWQDTQTSKWAPREFADGEAGQQQYAAALAGSVRDALEQIGLPDWAQAMLDSLGSAPALDQLASVMAQIGAIHQGFQSLAKDFPHLAAVSDEARTAMLAMAGGIDNLAASLYAARDAVRGAFVTMSSSLADLRKGVADADGRVAESRMAIWDSYSDAQTRLIDLEKQAADATRVFARSLRDYVTEMSTGPQSSQGLASRYRRLQAQLGDTASRAGSGDQSARDSLTSIASAYLETARERSSTSVDYAREAARVRVMLGNLATAAEADPLVTRYDAQALSLQQQIADAQIDVVKHLALMEVTGVSTDLGVKTVDKTLQQLRDDYVSAAQEQAAANLKLDVALAALDTLGLSEALVNAVAANQSSSLSAALNISDESLAAITGALGLTEAQMTDLGGQFATEVALLLGQTATDLADSLAGALAFDPAQFDGLRTIVGYDTASPDIEALRTILGFDLGAENFRALGTIVGLSGDAAGLLQGVWADGIGLSAPAQQTLANLLAGVSFAPAAAEQVNVLGAGVSWSSATGDQVTRLLSGVMLSPAASAQVAGLLDGLTLSAQDRLTVTQLLGGIGFDDTTTAALEAGLGVQPGLLTSLGQVLGLSPEARDALGVLSTVGTLDQTVRNAYALIGRTGMGAGVNQIDQGGFDYWRSQLATGGVTMDAFLPQFLATAASNANQDPTGAYADYVGQYLQTLGIPGFAVGTNYVTNDMLAVVHKGEAIVPAPFNPAVFGGGNADVVAELRQTNAQLTRMKEELALVKAELVSIKTSSGTTAAGMTGIVNKQVTLVTEVV